MRASIIKTRKGEISEWGSLYGVTNETDFIEKQNKFKFISQDVQKVDLEIESAISKAMDGQDPGLIIVLDDHKLNLEVYQQIVCKVYAVTRYRVY